MLTSLSRAKFPKLGVAIIVLALALLSSGLSSAQEQYPTVARISFVSGPVSFSRGDDPDEWDDAIENVPLTIGDRIYAPEDGRAELQLSSGNFVHLAPRSYFSALNLSDDIKQFYLGEGAASFNIRRLGSDEVIELDTPNVSVTLDQPGRYRIAVDEDGNSRISARGGRVVVAASGKQITVENSEIRVYGIDSPRYEIVALPATDAFDRWVAERDDRFERAYSGASKYASDEIIGVEDLSQHGRWEQIPEYGYAWTPTAVAAGWVPFSVGRWFWQDPWGWTWISGERWGWATSHYGRWTPYRSRWYWVPVRPRTRVIYAPACVEFVRVRDHVGWFPLHPRDRFIPWWERRERQRDRNITYVNRTYVTVVNQNTFISARPVTKHLVRDSVVLREAGSARTTWEPLPIPSRSSLRVVSETGERRGHRPSANVLARAAVVRTAPPAPSPTFQEKLPEIQKSQGRPVAPSIAVALAAKRASRVPIRPAALETRGGDFAPRTPGGTSGPAPQPLTAARGKKLATQENPVDTTLSEKAKSAEKSSAQPPQPSPSEPNNGMAGRPESPRPDQDRDRQRQEKQTLERERQAQQQQQELERKKQAQQKEEQRKTQLQKQPAQEQSPQQRLEEMERRQAQQQQQARREQLRQQQLQERQAQQQQKQQEQERKALPQQKQQDQVRREQLRQQQLQEQQALQQQRQQELERRQLEQRQEHKGQPQQKQPDQVRREQLRQQQPQEHQVRELQKQQPPRRPQEPQKEQERKVLPQQKQPGQL